MIQIRRTENRPNFFIVGAAKCGTTSMHYYLKQHPEIFMSPVKEPKYFVAREAQKNANGPGDDRMLSNITSSWEDYLDLFSAVEDETVIGESSVLYLDFPDAARRVAEYDPSARIVIMLRQQSVEIGQSV